MQDAFGGIMNLILIALFLVIVEGILGFTVNYTKAFKMKNAVISAIEEYEGSHCIPTSGTSNLSACRDKIINSAKQIGYSPSVSISCDDGWLKVDNLFCAKELKVGNDKEIYRIMTQVDTNIPIIRNIMGLRFFQVSGDTRVIQKPN